MLSNKKASQYGVLITIIIVLLSAGALFSMEHKSTKVVDDVSEGLACYTFLGMKKATQDLWMQMSFLYLNNSSMQQSLIF